MHARTQLAMNQTAPSLFEPGRNCCAVARAGRVAPLVDGEEYFSAFAQAAERARSMLLIVGWDFGSSTRLVFDADAGRRGPPAELGGLLNWLVKRRRGLHVHVLDWDYPMLFGTDREFPPIYGMGWKPHRHVHVVYDNTHPVGASHHQKIVVVDDAVAFLGGIDLTARRWDTCAHRADDVRRCAGGVPYPPVHDLMLAVDGEAARRIGEVARWRWRRATGHEIGPAAAGCDPWPPDLPPALTDVDVAIARTLPAANGEAVREVEALYLDMIAAARHHIYIENQYFTAYGVGEALAARLAEPDGPEIVVVTRLSSHGWLEEHTMHVLRTRLIGRLREADRHGRFSLWFAHIDGLPDGHCIDVHSKVMIVDDEILRIGSANLCNRSMGMDTECDAAIEARGDPRIARAIRAFRNRLLGEHLDVPAGRVEAEHAGSGSLRAAIERLAGQGRTLKPLDDPGAWPDAVVTLARVADPEQPVALDELIEEFVPNSVSRQAKGARWVRLAAIAAGVFALTLMWRYTPLSEFVSADNVTGWAREFAGYWWAPLLILVAYTPACFVMFPRPLITLAAVIAFGPVPGFVLAMSGILIATFVTWVAGRALPRDTVRELAGEQLNQVVETIRRRSLLAMTALRLVPLAPFAAEGLVAGAIHIRAWILLVGTFLGMLPGTLATTVFGRELETLLRDPSQVSWALLAGVLTVVVVLTFLVRRWLFAQHVPPAPVPDGGTDGRPNR